MEKRRKPECFPPTILSELTCTASTSVTGQLATPPEQPLPVHHGGPSRHTKTRENYSWYGNLAEARIVRSARAGTTSRQLRPRLTPGPPLRPPNIHVRGTDPPGSCVLLRVAGRVTAPGMTMNTILSRDGIQSSWEADAGWGECLSLPLGRAAQGVLAR